MKLESNAIKELQKALNLSYGVEFTEEEAEMVGMKLVTLYEAILKTNHGEE